MTELDRSLINLTLNSRAHLAASNSSAEKVGLRLRSAVATVRSETRFSDDQINNAVSTIMNRPITSDVSLGHCLNDLRKKISAGYPLTDDDITQLTKLHILFKTINKSDIDRYTQSVFRSSRSRLFNDGTVDQNVTKDDEKQSSVFSSFTKALLFENFKQRCPATENIELLKAWQLYWDDLKYKEALFYNDDKHNQIIEGVRPTLYAKELASLLSNEEKDNASNDLRLDRMTTVYFSTHHSLEAACKQPGWIDNPEHRKKYDFFITQKHETVAKEIDILSRDKCQLREENDTLKNHMKRLEQDKKILDQHNQKLNDDLKRERTENQTLTIRLDDQLERHKETINQLLKKQNQIIQYRTILNDHLAAV